MNVNYIDQKSRASNTKQPENSTISKKSFIPLIMSVAVAALSGAVIYSTATIPLSIGIPVAIIGVGLTYLFMECLMSATTSTISSKNSVPTSIPIFQSSNSYNSSVFHTTSQIQDERQGINGDFRPSKKVEESFNLICKIIENPQQTIFSVKEIFEHTKNIKLEIEKINQSLEISNERLEKCAAAYREALTKKEKELILSSYKRIEQEIKDWHLLGLRYEGELNKFESVASKQIQIEIQRLINASGNTNKVNEMLNQKYPSHPLFNKV